MFSPEGDEKAISDLFMKDSNSLSTKIIYQRIQSFIFPSLDLCFVFVFVLLLSDAWRRRRRRRRRGKMDENETPAAEVQEQQDTHREAKQKIFEAFLDKESEDEQEDYDLNPKHPV